MQVLTTVSGLWGILTSRKNHVFLIEQGIIYWLEKYWLVDLNGDHFWETFQTISFFLLPEGREFLTIWRMLILKSPNWLVLRMADIFYWNWWVWQRLTQADGLTVFSYVRWLCWSLLSWIGDSAAKIFTTLWSHEVLRHIFDLEPFRNLETTSINLTLTYRQVKKSQWIFVRPPWVIESAHARVRFGHSLGPEVCCLPFHDEAGTFKDYLISEMGFGTGFGIRGPWSCRKFSNIGSAMAIQ